MWKNVLHNIIQWTEIIKQFTKCQIELSILPCQ